MYNLTLYAQQELKDIYDEYEIRSLCKLIFSTVFLFTNIDIHLKKYEYLDKSFINKFYKTVAALKKGEPIQYILGGCEFGGLYFQLDHSTLIPRPETEELIYWANEKISRQASILDIGTGSGCIAICLAHLQADTNVHGIDINGNAIKMARKNARKNQIKNVGFSQKDIMAFDTQKWDYYDLIISNPPYVRLSEKSDMQPRVTDHEPDMALFVPDDNPLVFYKAIAAFGQLQLRSGGYLFFEINEAFGNEMTTLMKKYGYSDVTLKKDLSGKERFIRCRRD